MLTALLTIASLLSLLEPRPSPPFLCLQQLYVGSAGAALGTQLCVAMATWWLLGMQGSKPSCNPNPQELKPNLASTPLNHFRTSIWSTLSCISYDLIEKYMVRQRRG
ncbi:hypothetical protein EJ06DRAFT_410963 [Trichodelitschia bisporula]|uniref:Uncharacterized protein n=1 Tax=Trichodelitschia bisporula TaxID=703511 RepID=A0A6G1HYF1_9PEZI|nr:hypothetical protein EJ06DRAFT_410963 [Trichodelitschia bisporula]